MKIDKQTWLAIQGLMILIVLVTLLIYTYNNYQIQKEVRDDCGWNPNDKVSCVCTKTAWNQYQGSLSIENGSLKLENTTFEEWNP